MIKFLLFLFFYKLSFGLSFSDAILHSVHSYFKDNVESNPNFKIYSFLIIDIIEEGVVENNKILLTAQKILIMSILLEVFCNHKKKEIDKNYIKKEFYRSMKTICNNKKKLINNNELSLLFIFEAHNRISRIKKYSNYCKMIAPHWFNKETYFEDTVEYNGPNLKKSIDEINFKFINENLYGPAYFIFIYALTQLVVDSIK